MLQGQDEIKEVQSFIPKILCSYVPIFSSILIKFTVKNIYIYISFTGNYIWLGFDCVCLKTNWQQWNLPAKNNNCSTSYCVFRPYTVGDLICSKATGNHFSDQKTNQGYIKSKIHINIMRQIFYFYYIIDTGHRLGKWLSKIFCCTLMFSSNMNNNKKSPIKTENFWCA